MRSVDPPPPPLAEKGTVRLEDDRLAFGKDEERLVAAGRLEGTISKRITGKVEVEFVRLDSKREHRGKHRTVKHATIEPDGSFQASLKTCRKGAYKAFAEYRGSGAYEPLGRTRVGEKERVRGC